VQGLEAKSFSKYKEVIKDLRVEKKKPPAEGK